MKIEFTKMQGAGNDFVVLDETRGLLGLSPAQYRFLGDRHFGVGADQILSVRAAPGPDVDFEYVIHNPDGNEVEQCGNGARCFARFVQERGLSDKPRLRVQTRKGVIVPELGADGRVTVDMGLPRFEPEQIPLKPERLRWNAQGQWGTWEMTVAEGAATLQLATVSMGNPHAVLLVDDVDRAQVSQLGPQVQASPCFPEGVNVGFLQWQQRDRVRLRVYERGVGETLACGSGACAAVVAGIRLGLLDARVDVHTRGGVLTIAWDGNAESLEHPVRMTGPAVTVFRGSIELPAQWP